MAMVAEQWGSSMPMNPGGMMPTGPGGMMPPGSGGAAWDAQRGMGMGGCTPFGSNASQTSLVANDLKRLFLLNSPEEQKFYHASELMMRATEHDVIACIPLILNKLVNFAPMHPLGIHVLGELLQRYPHVVSQRVGPNEIYDLFNPSVADGPAANFLYNLFCCKMQWNGGNVNQECIKLQKLLLRRSKTQDLRKVVGSKLRSCLCKVWADFPQTRPERQMVVQCCARWIADANTPPEDKVPCLTLLQQELEMRRPEEADVLLVSLLLEQVCRDPVGHSPDLQQLLWLRNDDAPNPTVLKPILFGLAEETGRLVTLWICLCLWPPQPGPQRSPPPIHAFLRSMLVAYAQFANSSELCRTCLLSLAGVAASGNGNWSDTAAAASDLLLLLYDGGPYLSRDVWQLVATILQGYELGNQFASAHQLLARIIDPAGTSQQFGSQGALQVPQPMAYQNAYPQGNGAYPQADPQVGGAYPQMGPQAGGAYPQMGQQVAPQGGAYPPQTQQAMEPPPDGRLCLPATPPKVGLRNINNTCYMNTVVQGLFMTNSFLHDLYNFKLGLKQNPSVVDKEDYDLGKKIVKKMQRHMAKMLLTHHPHTDIEHMLSVFPGTYRNGEQQDVTECIQFLFDKLGGPEQQLIRDTFAGELKENSQCQVCGNVRGRAETFTDMVLTVPPEEEVMRSGIPTCQQLLARRLDFELMTDDNLLFCERCQKNTKTGKWAEIASPPKHFCIYLNRFGSGTGNKEKTPVNIMAPLQVGPHIYELYFVIIHTGKDASSGHYYAIGSRAEMSEEEKRTGQKQWWSLDDSSLKPWDRSLEAILTGTSEKKDDNPYALFYRCQQAPPTPMVRLDQGLAEDIKREVAQEQYS